MSFTKTTANSGSIGSPDILPVDPEHDYYTPFALGNSSNGLYISSASGAVFHVHAVIMQMASGVFRDMINGAENTGEIIALQEGTDILKALLDIIHPTSNGTSFGFKGHEINFVWALLRAADKYDIHKITSEIRERLTFDPYFQSYPLESYAIACRYSWKAEMKHTLSGALDHLNTPNSWEILAQLDAIHITRLYRLLNIRKAFMEERVKRVSINHLWNHPSSYYDSYKYPPNEGILLALVGQELDKRPSGETLKSEFWERSEVKFLISERACGELKRIITDHLKNLPTDIDEVTYD